MARATPVYRTISNQKPHQQCQWTRSYHGCAEYLRGMGMEPSYLLSTSLMCSHQLHIRTRLPRFLLMESRYGARPWYHDVSYIWVLSIASTSYSRVSTVY